MDTCVFVSLLCSPLCEFVPATKSSLLLLGLQPVNLRTPSEKWGFFFPSSSNKSASHFVDSSQMPIHEPVKKGCSGWGSMAYPRPPLQPQGLPVRKVWFPRGKSRGSCQERGDGKILGQQHTAGPPSNTPHWKA